ncbi:MAG: pyridoxal phosphate-dependent aminotransferase [Fimbriimonadaceae bacterium]|nr:pyridoxal phosphate-dependent aminotransferase [Chitinophagales bacterium]
MHVSKMAENLIGSEIIKLAAEITQRMKQGEKIYNMTIGDFDPKIFPIPKKLEEEIIHAYRNNETNYPAANGIERLRIAAQHFIKKHQGLDYDLDEFLIAGGGRPLIYATYITLLDAGDKVIYPVPSWNNNHYVHLSHCEKIEIQTKPENNFMPTADEIAPHIKDATLIALCSPLNPTGTTLSKNSLQEICDLVITENNRRSADQKPLYILFDQLYWTLTFGEIKHCDPVSLRPELKDYVIYIDGLSKAFSATGIRVGWSFGPKQIIDKMKSILSHIGAWSPKPEQVAAAKYLMMDDEVNSFLSDYKNKIQQRLDSFYAGFKMLQQKNYPVECIAPQAAIYLTLKIDFRGATTAEGNKINTMQDVSDYILDEAKIGLVPFYAFGSSKESPWFRLSIGTCSMDDVKNSIESLERALNKLKF